MLSGLSISSAFAVVALAEIGDKSHLMCMALATRYPARPILWGALLAYGALNLLAVGVGASLGAALPAQPIAAVAALIFLVSGALALRAGDDADDSDDAQADAAAGKTAWQAMLAAAGVLLLAELGDRTQLTVATLSATLADQAAGVWLGATAGMVMHAALGVWLGRALLYRLPARALRRAAAALFFAFAVLAALRALGVTAP